MKVRLCAGGSAETVRRCLGLVAAGASHPKLCVSKRVHFFERFLVPPFCLRFTACAGATGLAVVARRSGDRALSGLARWDEVLEMVLGGGVTSHVS